MPHCIDSNTIVSISERFFDGENWEIAIQQDKEIKDLSSKSATE
jgi:hypothetical protein